MMNRWMWWLIVTDFKVSYQPIWKELSFLCEKWEKTQEPRCVESICKNGTPWIKTWTKDSCPVCPYGLPVVQTKVSQHRTSIFRLLTGVLTSKSRAHDSLLDSINQTKMGRGIARLSCEIAIKQKALFWIDFIFNPRPQRHRYSQWKWE